jgi:N-acetylmuramoyl-L-alanine amidase
MPDYRVKQGECISSIAQRHGFFWETIWNHPNNAELKQRRGDPNVLYPGDVLFIPEKEEKQESGATEQRHRFRLKGVPAMLRIRLMDNDEPRGDESYTLEIDGELLSGTTDDDGNIEQPIPPDASRGRLLVGEAQDEYLLDLGRIDPIGEISGVQARLNNLGFDCGEVDGVLGPRTKAALREFQANYGLTDSGTADQATRDKLLEVHGS